jgi:hypothetical protein
MSWTITSGGVPAAIAGVAPLVDYRFAVDRNEIDAVSLTDKLTVTTVDADGTFVNQAGLIQQATTNIPRFDHGPASRQSLGLLVEESRENLLLQSENFSTSWALANIRAFGSGSAVNDTTAPDGTLTADLLTESLDVSSSNHNIAQAASVTTGVVYTVSVFAKLPVGSTRQLQILVANSNFTVTPMAVFNLSNGTIASSGNGTAAVVAFPNGWYRLILTTIPSTSSGANSFNLRFHNGSTNAYIGDGTSGIYLWGAQLETGASPTSYIPTTTTATTRSADDIKIAAGLSGTADVDYTIVEKPAGCVAVSGSDIVLNTGFTAQRVMVFPGNVSALRTAIRAAM